MLKAVIRIARVRTGGCVHSHRNPSRTSRTRCERSASVGRDGRLTLDTITAPASSRTALSVNGSAMPSPNSNAPTGGPASWLPTTLEPCSRAFARPSPVLGTTTAIATVFALSAKVSAVPSRNNAR
jgi:hypothetical protein